MRDLSWMERAACRDVPTRAFFEDAWDDDGNKPLPALEFARSVCDRCPVLAECREEVLSRKPGEQHGVQAAMTPPERRGAIRTARRKRREAAKAES